MALRVWLPLNGSVENKGISNTTMSGSPASWGNGKIGKCATFTGNVGNVIYNNTTDYNYTDKFSWAVWINTNFTGTTSQFAFTNGRADAGGYGYGLQCSNATTCNIRFGSQSFGVAVTGGEWTHLAFTKSGTSIKVYKNGSIVTDTTFSGTLPTYSDGNGLGLGCFHYSGNIYPFYGSLNDFRIYDHCLSPKEVKEISQGLVLHYKLDGWSGGAGENLLSKYVTPGQQNPGATSSAGRTNYYGDYGIIIPATENADTYFRLFTNTQLQQNAQYTISCEASGLSSGTYYNFPLYAQNNTSMGVLRIDHNGICSLTFTMTYATQTAMTVDGKTVYLCFMDDSARTLASGQGAITIKNFKIEKGSKATQWSPAPQDLGIDTTKITDSSGYGNDGTIIGTLSTESDSDRYEISTHYPGSSYTDTGSGTFNWFDFSQCTLSAWIKPTASVSGWSGSIGVQHNQNAGHKGFTITDYANNFRVVTVNGSYTTIDSGKQLTVGEWHHCAAVLNGTNLKMYYDGAMVKESTVSWGSAAIATDMRFATGVDFPGSDEMFTGNYSDIRMYCTALSAEDILDLYHTSANIDDLYNIHSFEYNEIFTSNLYDFSAPWTYENLTGSTVDTDMGQAIKLVTSSTNQRAYKNVSNIWTTSGKQFVVSFIAKSDIEGITCDMSRSIADFTDKFTLSTKWKRYTGTITVTSTSTGGTLSFRINQSGATVYILGVKLEEANKNLISATKQGELLENNIDEIEYLTISKFKKESSNIIAKDFIEK